MRAVIIGCGPSDAARGGAHSISYAHGWGMQHVGDANAIQLVAAASRSEKNVQDFVAEFPGIHGYTDYREMLTKERPEFVSICAFPPDRVAMVEAALEAGAKAILVEKPFAVSLKDAQRMIQAAKTHGARLFVHFQRRYGKPFEWVKTAVAEGKIGRLIGAQIVQPGPQLINFGPHLIDAVLNIMNAPTARQPVSAFAAVQGGTPYQGVPAEEQLIGLIRFSDGTRLTVESGNTAIEQVPILRFDGEEGFAELRLMPVAGEGGIARGRFRGEVNISVLETEENFHHGAVDRNLYVDRAFRDIVNAVKSGAPCQLDAEAVLPGLEVLLALFESARQQKTVALPLAQQDTPF